MREADIGLEVYLTQDIPGIGGKLRKTPEDFEVEELSLLPPENPQGKYVIARIWRRNWETNRLVRRLAGNLKVGRARIGFAGTKDGRAVATQLMSFNAPLEDVQALFIPDVRVLEAYKANRMISIGDLVGNKFKVMVSEIKSDVDAKGLCEAVSQRLDAVGGFPNFFGIQRFGSIRPITHLIGKDLIGGDFEGAAMRYIANPLEEDDSEATQARRNLQESGDFEKALYEFPRKLTFERMMIGYLKDNPGDYLGALRILPRNLLMMFVHAYQSYLFNRMLSERIKRGVSIGEPALGDLVLPLNKNAVPDHDNPILVTTDNLEKALRMAREKKAFVSGLLYGTDSTFAGGVMGEIESETIAKEKISRSDFQIVGLREASSKGSRRELLSVHHDLIIQHEENRILFSFWLSKGCYATTLMREFMKADLSQY